MHKAHPRPLTQVEQLRVPLPNLGHLVFRDFAVVQRDRPVGRALEDGQGAGRFRDFGDGLDGGGAGADDAYAFVCEGDVLRKGNQGRMRLPCATIRYRLTSWGHLAVWKASPWNDSTPGTFGNVGFDSTPIPVIKNCELRFRPF